ncbi:MAG: alpha/beta hydrolase [Myxococcota bacterium]|jgi:3-oxoadipate enol-lactonase
MSEPHRVEASGHSLRVQSSGSGSRHFLCLHGLVDTIEIWKRLAPALEERGRLCRIDQRGHGESDAPLGPYSREDLAGDVIAALDAEEVEKTILIGHSMGGIVAMATALAYPERVAGLVLIGTTSQCAEKVAGWYERIALAGEKDGNPGLVRAIYGEKSKKKLVGDAQGISHVTRMLKSLFDDPLTPKLSELRCPVLAIVGEKDPMGSRASEIVFSALPAGSAELLSIADRGHWLHVEAVDEVVAALDRWLAKSEL